MTLQDYFIKNTELQNEWALDLNTERIEDLKPHLKKKLREFFTLTRKADGGFTLVELIVVIAILAILAGVAAPAYSGYVTRANKTADQTVISEVEQALELYYYRHPSEVTTLAVVLDQEGKAPSFYGDETQKTQAQEALTAAFGSADSVGLKYADWKGENSALSYKDSSYYGNESGLIQTVDTLASALGEVVAKDQSAANMLIGGAFKEYLTENEVDVNNGKAVGNATVLYVAEKTQGKEDEIKEAFKTTVTAKFLLDPLYNQATVPSDSAYTKDQLVSINSRYYHDGTNELVEDTEDSRVKLILASGTISGYSKTAGLKMKDGIDIQYIPSLVWSDTMSTSCTGNARGDYVDAIEQETFAYIHIFSDVIRIEAKENCTISFDYTNNTTLTAVTEDITEDGTTRDYAVYAYITTSANATVTQIKGSTLKYTDTSGSTGAIALSKGNYLYILTEYYGKIRYFNMFDVIDVGQLSIDFDHSSSISNFTVEYNEKKDVLSAGFRDNTGKALGSGKISVNNVAYSIGTNGNMDDMTFADQASVELKVNSAPANYVHIGWAITPTGGTTTYQYTPTYTRTLTEDVTVDAIFVPKTTITMGTNGYTDATYKDFNGNALDGQYVARNADCTAYYTSLADAFGNTDTVVLLAGATITGDWEIPSGKTFVIPYGMNDNGSTAPTFTNSGISGVYCQVNLNGNLTVNGTLLVSALQNQNTGATGGNPGHLVIAAGKTITVNGSLYSYGPVTGEGKVEANAAAKIHETMEFSDNTVAVYIFNIYSEKASKKVFPFNTMFINSIEVPVTYQLGASLTGHVAVRYDTVSAAEVPIIAETGAMLNHTGGTITKYYDKDAGQFVFCFNEGSVVNSGAFSITMAVTVANVTRTYLKTQNPYRNCTKALNAVE